MSEVIFTTQHGSHLYGLAGPTSDLDTYTVTTSRHRARQRVSGMDDSTVIGRDAFLEYAFTGSHQAVEALFSPVKEWHSHRELAPLLDNYRITGGVVLAKYRRTITKFAHADDFKRRRHACRLWLKMQHLRWNSRFDPRMSEDEIRWATTIATSNMSGDELAEYLREGEGALSDIDLADDGPLRRLESAPTCAAQGCSSPAMRECQRDEWIAVCGAPLCIDHDCPRHGGAAF